MTDNPDMGPDTMNKPVLKRTIIGLAVLAIVGAEQALADRYALVNAAIYTVDPSNRWADAMAIDDGVIIALGTQAEISALVDDENIVDLEGSMVMPGFQDVHLHALEAGLNIRLCGLPSEASPSRYKALVEACATEQGESAWVMGAGVSMFALLEQHPRPVEILDAAVPDRPAVMIDDLGHGAWANSLALKAVGFDVLEGNPVGGIIDRDKHGRPSGVVFENAQQPLRRAGFANTAANRAFAYESLLGALEELARNGITTVSDAGGYWPRGHLEPWLRAEREGTLTVRASNALYVYPDRAFDAQLKELTQRYRNDPSARLRYNQVKIYVDGIISLGTSALYEPYETKQYLAGKDNRGFLYFDQETLRRYAAALDAVGFQLHFHATGDRGVGLALDAIEFARAQNGPNGRPHRITHLYLIHPTDRRRFKALNVVADFQLAPASTSKDTVAYLRAFIGERADTLLPVRSIMTAGAKVVLSSDWDADDLSPFVKIQSVRNRAVEAMPDLDTVIRLMTIEPARLLQHDDKTGALEVGKAADFIVLDRNLFETPVEKLHKTRVLATVLAGEPIYDPTGILD